MSDDGNERHDGQQQDQPKPVCGIVMPISEIDGLPPSHWLEVKGILEHAIRAAGFTPRLVSEADEIGVIHRRIVQNLYENPVVVCDVSAGNPNVMTELGMRLAFDKPLVIVKDDVTPWSFDTQMIEHVFYPRDLRHGRIERFKEQLESKIRATDEQARKDPDFSPFLKHFGKLKVAKLDTEEVAPTALILDELRELRGLVVRGAMVARGVRSPPATGSAVLRVPLTTAVEEVVSRTLAEMVEEGFDFDRADASDVCWDKLQARFGCTHPRGFYEPFVRDAISRLRRPVP